MGQGRPRHLEPQPGRCVLVPLLVREQPLPGSGPASLERRPEHPDETKALPRSAIERQLSRRDVPLREKTLWRMLYESVPRASEILALDLDARRAKVTSKGGAIEWVYWSSGTAQLLPRLLCGRSRGPVSLPERGPRSLG